MAKKSPAIFHVISQESGYPPTIIAQPHTPHTRLTSQSGIKINVKDLLEFQIEPSHLQPLVLNAIMHCGIYHEKEPSTSNLKFFLLLEKSEKSPSLWLLQLNDPWQPTEYNIRKANINSEENELDDFTPLTTAQLVHDYFIKNLSKEHSPSSTFTDTLDIFNQGPWTEINVFIAEHVDQLESGEKVLELIFLDLSCLYLTASGLSLTPPAGW
jgi:hypothetical protein